MTRFAHVLIAATYVMASIVIAAALVRFGDVAPALAFTFAGVLSLGAGQAHALWARRLENEALSSTLEDLRQANLLLADEVDETRARIGALETTSEETGAGVRQDALAAEIKTLETLVRDMGERMQAQPSEPSAISSLEPNAGPHAETVAKARDRALVLENVREALEEGRVDLHLQPIVTLPQRKVYFYEGFTRLRDARGRVMMPAEWLKVAEPAGLVGAIDNLLLFRCVQIVRRLAERERRVGIFCNISASSLGDDGFFPQFLDFVRRHQDLAGSLIFEIGQRDFLRRNHAGARNMARLADFGFRFSLDKVDDLDIDLAELQRAGVKFFKAPGALLAKALKAGRPLGISAAPDVRAEDYPALLARHGIELIAEKIETESTVVEVLELDVAFGQGHLFGPPRPIREEVLELADARGLQDQVRRKAAG